MSAGACTRTGSEDEAVAGTATETVASNDRLPAPNVS